MFRVVVLVFLPLPSSQYRALGQFKPEADLNGKLQVLRVLPTTPVANKLDISVLLNHNIHR